MDISNNVLVIRMSLHCLQLSTSWRGSDPHIGVEDSDYGLGLGVVATATATATENSQASRGFQVLFVCVCSGAVDFLDMHTRGLLELLSIIWTLEDHWRYAGARPVNVGHKHVLHVAFYGRWWLKHHKSSFVFWLLNSWVLSGQRSGLFKLNQFFRSHCQDRDSAISLARSLFSYTAKSFLT